MDLLLNAAIFIVTLVLTVRFFRKDGAWNPEQGRLALRFFTTQSNVLCAVSALLMCLFPKSEFAWTVKYVGTAAVTVTMLTVFFFLAPGLGKGGLAKLLKGSDLFMHLITPLAALLSFLVFERRGMSFGVSLWGMVPVILYGSWYLYKVVFAPEEKRWNDFYGFNKGGKWPVYFSCMMVGGFLVCMLLMGLQNL